VIIDPYFKDRSSSTDAVNSGSIPNWIKPNILKARAVFFNAGCNEQVFSPKPRKKLAQISLVVFEINAKTA